MKLVSGWSLLGTLLFPCTLALAGAAPRAKAAAVEQPSARALARAAAYAGARLDPAALRVQNQVVQVGELRLDLDAGILSRVKVDGKVVGLHFLGKGTLAYLAGDPAEAAVLRFNLDRSAGPKPVLVADGQRVEDVLEEAVVFFAGGEPPVFQGLPVKAPAESFKDHLRGFLLADGLPAPGQVQALCAGNGPHLPSVQGLFRCAGGQYHFLRDENGARRETFSLLRPEAGGSAQGWTVCPLSSSGLQGDSRRAPEPPFSLTQVDLDVRIRQTAPAVITALETVVPRRADQRILAFRLRSSFSRWVGDSSLLGQPSEVKIPITLVSVETALGRPLAFDHYQDRLLVKFPRALPVGEPVQLRFRIQDDSFSEHRKAQGWALTRTAWFPLASAEDPGFTVQSRFEVEKPCAAVAPGKVIKEEETATSRILATVMDRAVASFPCFGGALASTVLRDPRTRTALHFAFGARKDPEGLKAQAEAIQGMIATFESMLGPFPFPDLLVVKREGALPGVVEPGVLFLEESRHAPKAAVMNEDLARAVASQYWWGSVRGRGLDAAWIGQAFTEVSTVMALSRRGNPPLPALEDAALARWTQDARLANAHSTLSHAGWLRPRPGDYSWETGSQAMLQLGKGPLVLHRILEELGEKAFLDFLAGVQRAFAWKTCDAAEIAEELGRATGRNWEPFFERFYWDTQFPAPFPDPDTDFFPE